MLPVYISKYNCDKENQANLLMITDGKKMGLSCDNKYINVV